MERIDPHIKGRSAAKGEKWTRVASIPLPGWHAEKAMPARRINSAQGVVGQQLLCIAHLGKDHHTGCTDQLALLLASQAAQFLGLGYRGSHGLLRIDVLARG